MEVAGTDIAEIMILKPVRHADSRGFFSEIYRENMLSGHGIDVRFDVSAGTSRGVH